MAEQHELKPNPFDAMTKAEKEAMLIAELYHTHKVRGSLGTFYQMYAHLAPPPRARARDEGGRER